MNFLEETNASILKFGHTPDQILFIGSERSGHECTWEEFCKLANFEYNYGHDTQKVACDLIIVFNNGDKLWRYKYNGKEGWGARKPFTKPKEKHNISELKIRKGDTSWVSLFDIN